MTNNATNSWGMMQEILEEEEMRAKERLLKKEQKVPGIEVTETPGLFPDVISSNPAVLNE
tara:strand:- start:458 stop:637 length:180 start_codon:yes stop_codon:yes gene_type:complete